MNNILSELEKLMGDTFPEEVVLIKFITSEYCCAFLYPYRVLLTYSSVRYAKSSAINDSLISHLCSQMPYTFEIVTFDEARDIAKERNLDALMLYDDSTNPIYHFLK